MISKETQYRLYAGTSNDDYTGWVKKDTSGAKDLEIWSLDLGNGYVLERAAKTVRRFFKDKTVYINTVHKDRTVSDPDGPYQDVNYTMVFNVSIKVSKDSIVFEGPSHSCIVLSREPVEWNDFSENVPTFDDKEFEDNWSSFYS